MEITIKESFEDGNHVLEFSNGMFSPAGRDTDEVLRKVFTETLVTPKSFEKGTLKGELVDMRIMKYIWRRPLRSYEPGELNFRDVMLVLNTLDERPTGVITDFTAIPFDPATGFYLGKETDTRTPSGALTLYPRLADQLDRGRTIGSDKLSTLLNVVACEGQLPTWLDDETGSLSESLLEMTRWYSLCSPERTWVLEYSHMATLKNAIIMVKDLPETAQEAPWVEPHGLICMDTLRLIVSATGAHGRDDDEMQSADSVEAAVAGIKEVNNLWDLLDVYEND